MLRGEYMTEPLTLCFICKNGDQNEMLTMRKMLKSVKPYVNDICATVTLSKEDESIDVALMNMLNDYECKVSTFVWTNNFSDARNFNFAQAETDLVLWLDTDDELIGGEHMASALEMFDKNANLNELWFYYDYDRDKDGNTLSWFPRERIVRKSTHKWIGMLHENCICDYMPVGVVIHNIVVRHNAKHENIEAKAIRNLNIIREAYSKEKKADKLDPRTVYDLARSYHAMFLLKEAEEKFREFLGLTSSEQDYYDAMMRLVDIYISTGRLQVARDACHQSIKVKYEWPEAYLELAKCAFVEELWDECLHWISIARTKKPPMGGMPLDPTKYTIKTAKMVEMCFFMQNKAEQSLNVINEALKVVPSDEHLLKRRESVLKFLSQQSIEKGFLQALDWLEINKEQHKIPHLLKALPEAIRDLPQFIRLYNRYHPVDGNDRLVIYCHSGFEKWDGDSWKDGIGGSEEAVINISQHLVKLGWKVEVYNECRNPGVYKGVSFQPYHRFDPSQPCDVFIAWRIPEYLVFSPQRKETVKIIWLHDKQQKDYYSPQLLADIDKLFVMSEYHRKDLPEFPDDIFYVTRNGIDPDHFKKKYGWNERKNNYIYASSPDRGLEYILKNWKQIREINPDATLHVFYGFTKVYDKLMENDPGRREFKEKIMKLTEQDGIEWHGRVGHLELADWFARCAWWLYPTDFPEIFCITAVKAQAAGCWPICTDFAALKETVKYGTVTSGKIEDPDVQAKWVDSIAKAREDATPDVRAKARKWALDNFSWEVLAKDWSKRFKEMRDVKKATHLLR